MQFLFEHCQVAFQQHHHILISLLLAGLVGGFSHCVGMCGPFFLAQTSTNSAKPGSLKHLSGAMLLPYHLGRMTTYTLLGVITKHAYQKGLNYNKTIAAVEAQSHLHWKSAIQIENERLLFSLTDSHSTPITQASVIAYIIRPTQSGYDFSVPLTEVSPGHYATSFLQFPLKGQWDINVVTTWNDQQHQTNKRIIIK